MFHMKCMFSLWLFLSQYSYEEDIISQILFHIILHSTNAEPPLAIILRERVIGAHHFLPCYDYDNQLWEIQNIKGDRLDHFGNKKHMLAGT